MRKMFVLNVYGFMQTLLDRKDRMSMYSGLEVRVPFCDHRLVEYAYNMPWEIKAEGGREKAVVRRAMEGILPDEIVWRKKSPYPKTHHPLYFRLVHERVMTIFEDKRSLVSELISRQAVETLCEHPDLMPHPWYGQLMGVPQVLAYLIQIDAWARRFNIILE